jgi:hypothetical protein
MPKIARKITINNPGSLLIDQQVLLENLIFPEAGLSGSWHFNEGSGTTTMDGSAFKLTGTLGPGVSFNPSGRHGSGLDFTLDTSVVTLENDLNSEYFLPKAGNTYMCWVKLTGTTSPAVANSWLGLSILGDVSGYFGFYRATIGGTDAIWVWHWDGTERKVGVPYTVDTWIHIAAVFTGTQLLVYANGTLVGTVASGIRASDSTMRIGKSFGNSARMVLDEVKFFRKVLTAGEIAAFANANDSDHRSDYKGWNFYSDQDLENVLPWWKLIDGKFWIKTTLVPGDNYIYLGYGDALDGTDTSNPANVFEFFDNFQGTTIDSAKWNEIDGGTVFTQNNKLIVASSSGWNSSLNSKQTFNRSISRSVHWHYRGLANTYEMFGWKDESGNTVGNYYADLVYSSMAGNNTVYEDGNSRTVNSGLTATINFVPYISKVTAKTTTGAIYSNSIYNFDTYQSILETAYSSESNLRVALTNYDRSMHVHAVFVTKEAPVTFTISLGPEYDPPESSILSSTINVSGINRATSIAHSTGVAYSNGMSYVLYWPTNSEHEALGLDTISFKYGDFN